MAQILKSTDGLPAFLLGKKPVNAKNYSTTLMNGYIRTYWGSIENERMFVIPYWKVLQIFQTHEELALRVQNIADANSVDATWMPYADNDPLVLADASDPSITYFVLNKNLFLSNSVAILENGDPVKGFYFLGEAETPDNRYRYVLCGRIGLSPTNNHHIFCMGADCVIKTGGIGNGGSAGGAQIPAS